jgi:AcrR family transcriptional regulator
MARAGARAGRPAGAAGTRRALVLAAVDALREAGFSGASAREIARRAGCSQALVFYHFGSVTELLLAALDEVSAVRYARYHAAVQAAGSVPELVAAARSVFEEDLDNGHAAVLAEMISGAQVTPGLGAEIAARIRPWQDFAVEAISETLSATPAAGLLPPQPMAHALVALYLGLEMLSSLEGDRAAAREVFDQADVLAALLDLFGRPSSASSEQQEGP